MSYGVRQFLLTDPGGNTLRVGQPISDSFAHPQAPKERFARALQTAGLLADSKEDTEAAARLLDRILASDAARSATEQVQALVLRAETALRMDQRSLAERLLGQARRIQLTDQDRRNIRDDLHRAEELAQALAQDPETPPPA
jgi:hypothetical protein